MSIESPKRRSWLFPAVMIIVIVLLLIGFAVALDNGNRGSVNSGSAPDFTVKLDDSGQLFKLSEKRGKVVILNFWASWCGPCRDEAPILNKLWVDYRDKGVEFLGIGYLDNTSDAKNFKAEFGMAYPTTSDDGGIAARAYHMRQVPETYLIDKKGVIRVHIPAQLTANNIEEFRTLLDQLVAS